MLHLSYSFLTCFFLQATTFSVSATSTQPPNSPCIYQGNKIQCQTENIPSSISSREMIQTQIHALQAHLDATAPHPSLPPLSPPRLSQKEWDKHNSTNNTSLSHKEINEQLPQDKTLIVIAIIVVTAIVAISIGFEKWHEWLDENVPEVLTPVLKSIFGELTVLGFIGLIMFVTTKVGKKSLDHLVCDSGQGWWSDDEDVCPRNETTGEWNEKMGCPENPLIELTEQAHMILFGVMVLFLAESVALIQIGMSRMNSMEKHEQRCISDSLGKVLHKHSVTEVEYKKLGCIYHRATFIKMLRCCPCIFKICGEKQYATWKEHDENDEFLAYQAIRRGFIKAYNLKGNGNAAHSLKGDFDFAQYSVKVLAERLGEIVELTPDNWFVIWLIFIIFLGCDFVDLITGSQNMLLVVCAIGLCYCCCIIMFFVHQKIDNIYVHLIHPFHLPETHILRKKTRLARNFSSVTNLINVNNIAKNWRRKSLNNTDQTTNISGFGIGGGMNLRESLLKTKEASESKETKTTAENPGWNAVVPSGGLDQTRDLHKIKNDLLTQAGVISAQLDLEHKPLYKYHYSGEIKVEPNEISCCGCFCKHTPTAYEDMYWMGKYGINLLFGYIRTQMVLIALYLGVFIVVLSGGIQIFFHEMSNDYPGIQIWGPFLIYGIGIIPPIIMLVELTTIIPLLVRIASTEQKISGDCVNITLRYMKSRRALRALHNISCFMAHIDKVAGSCLDAARGSKTFSELSKQKQQRLMQCCQLHNYKKGTIIVEQGKPNDKLYIISEGTADVVVNGEVKALLVAGKEFGKISLFTRKPCNASIIVRDKMVCFTVDQTAVREVLGETVMMQEEEQFVEIAGGARSLTPEHMESKSQVPRRRSSLLDGDRWNNVKDWVTHGKIVELNGMRTMGLSTKKNGVLDAWLCDLKNTGKINAIGFDKSGNGVIDTYDTSIDCNVFDALVKANGSDTNGDGSIDTLGIDTNGDGLIDSYMVDTNGDGAFDSVGFDTNHDGKVDAYDIDGDGLPDILKDSMADVMRRTRPAEVTAQQRKKALIDLFHAIDAGGDGNISSDEMFSFLTAVRLFVGVLFS